MELDTLCRALGFAEKEKKVLEPFFAEFQNNCDENFPEFMAPENAIRYFPYVKRDIPVKERMQTVAGIVEKNPAVRFFANMLYYGFYRRTPWCIELNQLAHIEKVFGENTGIFYLMIALGAFPLIFKRYKEMDIPQEMAEKTALWLGGAMDIYAAGHHNIPGFNSIQLHWLRHAADGKLFRIGRLEYLLHEYPDWVPLIYRSRENGKICLLSRPGITYTQEGRRPGPEENDNLITSFLEDDGNNICGYRILPDGYADMSKITVLDKNKWECMADANEIVPGIHIPAGEALPESAIKQSMQDAVKFFKEYLHLKIRMFVSCSWLFFYEWQKELPDSNIAAFAQEGYCFPTFPLNRTGGLFFVFGRSGPEIEKLPQNSSLEKAFHRILNSGRLLGECGWLFLTDDIEKYGCRIYRKQYDIQ